jgi:hypothetical protein
VLREQLTANPANAPLLPPAMAAIAELEAGRHVELATIPQPLLPLFHPAVQDFLINQLAKDPARLAGAYAGPMLIVQGATDLQTTVQDAQALKAGQPKAELVVLDGVNHLLKDAPADRAANFATYAKPDLPLDNRIVPTVAGFIKAR